MSVATNIECDLLLFFATSSERDALREAADHQKVPFTKMRHTTLGRFYSLDRIGDFRINAVRTEMGPIGYGGSASQGIFFKSATGATSIIQLGMAFGVGPQSQKPGDVLISSSLIPYDNRDVRSANEGYFVDYARASRHSASPSMLHIFQEEALRMSQPVSAGQVESYGVHIGAILSGSARIHCRSYRDQLVSRVPAGDDRIVGGEMEGIGLLSVSPKDDPAWIIVKGISDFADEDRDAVIEANRPVACRNSASFVLAALINAKRT